MKTVICNIPMKKNVEKMYSIESIQTADGVFKAAYAINVILVKYLEKNDAVHVLLMKSKGGDNQSDFHAEEFKKELEFINKVKNLNADITYEEIDATDLRNKDGSADIFRRLIGSIKKGSEIYADVTYNYKLIPMIVFCALNFAEKYLDAEVKKIIYGYVDIVKDKVIQGSESIIDITMLYCLNSLTHNIDCDNEQTAIKIIDDFLAL